ncbi:unnamed protein product [Caenorhabditis brenneri]
MSLPNTYSYNGLYKVDPVRERYDKMKRKNYLIDGRSPLGYIYPGNTPKEFILTYGYLLSPYEMKEVSKYGRLYCYPLHGSNLGQTEFEGLLTQLTKKTSGSHIDYRYQIKDRLGSYAFSADDMHLRKKVVVKLVKHRNTHQSYVFEELEMLLHLKSLDPDNVQNFVQIWDYGYFRGEQYIVMNHYNTDLKNFMNEFYPNGIPLPMIAKMGRSILKAMVFLKQHELIHGDIQPSNILLNHGNIFELKLCSFKQNKHIHLYNKQLTGLHYRSPECFCASQYKTTAIDMWAFACTIGEMVDNKIFLKGEHEQDQFYLYLEVLNLPPNEFIDSRSRYPYFFPEGICVANEPRHCSRNEKGEWEFHNYYYQIPAHRKHPGASPLKKRFTKEGQSDLNNFITRTIRWVPEKRLTPEHVLNINFFYEPTPTPTPAPSPEPTESKPEELSSPQNQNS